MKRILAIIWMNLRAVPDRAGSSLVIVIGIAGVVAVLVALLAMAQGFGVTLKATGQTDRVMFLSAGVTAELSSVLGPDVVPVLRELPGIARDAAGKPLASAEIVVITELKRGTGAQRADVNVSLRGVEPAGLTLRPELKLVEGRWFTPGLRELVVGKGAATQFEGVKLGAVLKFRGSEWTVVGTFSADGDAHESELWTDADTARSAFGRGNSASSLLAQMTSAEAIEGIKASVKADPRLQVDAMPEVEYYASQSKQFTEQIGVLTSVVAIIMAIGALFGALNSMYSAVSTRQVEIATLRAIGFSGLPVVLSVLAEAMLLALTGGVLGAAIAYVLFNNMSVSTLGANFTQVAFNFAVTPALMQKGLGWALAIGLLGGLPPALKAARQPVVEALRAK
ncbi:MAG: ABC transporter permease [Pseudomonadota bacterium]